MLPECNTCPYAAKLVSETESYYICMKSQKRTWDIGDSGAPDWCPLMAGKHKAYAWDYEMDKQVQFLSDEPCCSSCSGVDSSEKMMDDPCCCVHGPEYSQRLADADPT